MVPDDLRQDYEGEPLHKDDCAADPTEQFQRWFDQAVAADIEMANAMTLATVDKDGAPHARIVLLKDADPDGFVFFTNYESHKASELAVCKRASLLFWWHAMTRQVRIEGTVEKVSAAESDSYFRTRPRASNLAAIASPQSRPVDSRQVLEKMIADVTAASPAELERPSHWGGYRLKPTSFEFWQGRPDRSHDRIEYRLDKGATWSLTRLCP